MRLGVDVSVVGFANRICYECKGWEHGCRKTYDDMETCFQMIVNDQMHPDPDIARLATGLVEKLDIDGIMNE